MSIKSKSANLSILNIDILELMRQICLKDLELFNAITKEEINSFNWTKDCKKSMCPNLMMSTKQFNKINFWVQKHILDHTNTQKEVVVLTKFIKLSKSLLDNNNFQSAYAIKAALDSTPIHRLEQLWSRLSKKHLVVWEKLCSVFCVENNYQNLRNAMIESKLPTIPFIGVYLCDLTGLDAAYPKVGGVETEARKSNMEKVYDTIWYYQQSKYGFKIHPGIQDYIQSMEYMEEFEHFMVDNNFHISKALEPDSTSRISDCSVMNNLNIPRIQINNSNDCSPCVSNENSPERFSFQVSSSKDRKLAALTMPSSSMLSMDRAVTCMTPEWQSMTTRNLLDDSEVVNANGPNNDGNSGSRNNDYFHCTLKHSASTTSLSKVSSGFFGLSPANRLNQFSSFRKSDIETKSFIHYKDPDKLSTNQNMTLVLEGAIKKKLKSKQSFDIGRYQKVLAKLIIERLDCYINFFVAKGSKTKTCDDFKDEYQTTISLLEAELSFDNVSNEPKIYIDLYQDTHILKSLDCDARDWPSLDQWWLKMLDARNSVLALKTTMCESPDNNLINLDAEFTRL